VGNVTKGYKINWQAAGRSWSELWKDEEISVSGVFRQKMGATLGFFIRPFLFM